MTLKIRFPIEGCFVSSFLRYVGSKAISDGLDYQRLVSLGMSAKYRSEKYALYDAKTKEISFTNN